MDEIHRFAPHQLAQTPACYRIKRSTHGERSNAQPTALCFKANGGTRLTGNQQAKTALGKDYRFAEKADFLPAPAE
jgi:hypothetical protein